MSLKQNGIFSQILRISSLAAIVGGFTGLAAALFLVLLQLATVAFTANQNLVFLLPIAGYSIGWVYLKFGGSISRGTSLILDEIQTPQTVIPFRLTPMILVSTVVTHLFGGSAGREGTVVQMGASLADKINLKLKKWTGWEIQSDERRWLMIAGLGAGFAAAVGAPWAGAIFGIELVSSGKIHLRAARRNLFLILTISLIAAWTAVAVTDILQVRHTAWPRGLAPDPSMMRVLAMIPLGISFGLAARLFILTVRTIEGFFKRLSFAPLRPLIGGLLLTGFYFGIGSFRYAGLGLSIIEEAIKTPASFWDPVAKTLATSLTVGSGFKGGEFIPLVFIGSTLGSALGSGAGSIAWLASPFPNAVAVFASAGFAAVFAGASKTPLACTVMAIELFGFEIAPFALIACYVSFATSGSRSLYNWQNQNPVSGDLRVRRA